MPGVLPVLNREVVELAIRLGLALGCTIAPRSRFARKHYFYPDLPKGYQISQYDEPICAGGSVPVAIGNAIEHFALRRIHLEEDAGKTIHDDAAQQEPRRLQPRRRAAGRDRHRARPALARRGRRLPEGACTASCAGSACRDGNMEEGNFRCDANVSVRPRGQAALGTRTELKNINSFRFVGRAIEYEIARQIELLERGGAGRPGDAPLGRGRRPHPADAHQGGRPTTTATSPTPTCLVLDVDERWIARVRRRCPSCRAPARSASSPPSA